MLRSTFSGFSMAQMALSASQRALDVTGQNLSNINTAGYTRQRLDLVSLTPTGPSPFNSPFSAKVGMGVLMTGVSQIRDPFLDIQYRNQITKVGTVDAMNTVLGQIGDVFDESDKAAIKEQLADIVSQLDKLSQSGKSSNDSIVKASFEVLLNYFHQNAGEIDTVKGNVADKLAGTTGADINELLENIQNLSKSIKSSQILGDPALELQDQRNALIDELATYVPIRVSSKEENLGGGVKIDVLKIDLELTGGKTLTIVDGDKIGKFDITKDSNNGCTVRVTDTNEKVTKTIASPKDNWEDSLKENEAKVNQLLEDLAQKYTDIQNAATTDAKAALRQERDNLLDELNNYLPIESDTANDNLVIKINGTNIELVNGNKANDINIDDVTITDSFKFLVTNGAGDETYGVFDDDAIIDQNKVNDINTSLSKLVTIVNGLNNGTNTEADYRAEITTLKGYFKDGDTNIKESLTKGEDGKYTLDVSLNVGEKSASLISEGVANKIDIGEKTITKPQITVADPTKSSTDPDRIVGAEYLDEIKENAIDRLDDGILKGNLDMINYDGTGSSVKGVDYYKNQFNIFVNEMATRLNEMNGYNPYDPNSKKYQLFETTDGSDTFTAENIKISEGWANGTTHIVRSENESDQSSANENILKMIKFLSEDKINIGDKSNISLYDFYSNIQNTQAIEKKSTESLLTNRTTVAGQAADSRDSITGVNLDEEVMNLMRYQQSYNAASRLMTTMDSLIDKLINGTGVL